VKTRPFFVLALLQKFSSKLIFNLIQDPFNSFHLKNQNSFVLLLTFLAKNSKSLLFSEFFTQSLLPLFMKSGMGFVDFIFTDWNFPAQLFYLILMIDSKQLIGVNELTGQFTNVLDVKQNEFILGSKQ